MITALILAAALVAPAHAGHTETASCDRTCRALAAQPPRELGWYWWPGVSR